jgi:hypothetical protein
MRKNCTSGSVPGAAGDRRPYGGGIPQPVLWRVSYTVSGYFEKEKPLFSRRFKAMKKSLIILLLLAGCSSAQTATPPSTSAPIQTELKQTKMESQEVVSELQKIASESKCITHKWKERGLAPSSYIKGMGLVYARALCNHKSEDVEIASAPVDLSKQEKDALAAYAEEFKNTGMHNDTPVNILRHNYARLCCINQCRDALP